MGTGVLERVSRGVKAAFAGVRLAIEGGRPVTGDTTLERLNHAFVAGWKGLGNGQMKLDGSPSTERIGDQIVREAPDPSSGERIELVGDEAHTKEFGHRPRNSPSSERA